jgi:hypothetical protein
VDILWHILFREYAANIYLDTGELMTDLTVFYNQMLDNLTASEQRDRPRYRQHFEKCRSWTNLMLGNAGDRASGIVRQTLRECFQAGVEFSHERYADLAAFSGDWWAGRCLALLVVEHENNISEFRGTISDLLRYQARQKVAVFYEDAASKQADLQAQVREVFDYFDQEGFSELGDTEYLIVFGPIGSHEDGIGKWSAMHFTNRTRRSITWL